MRHKTKGSAVKVEPIREMRSIKRIKRRLKPSSRDYALFVVGINTALRGGELLSLRAGAVRNIQAGDSLEIRQPKTKKLRRITLNGAAIEAIRNLLASKPFEDSDFLFQGQRGLLTRSTLARLVKEWCRIEGLHGNFSSHTLRKTWGYHQRVSFGTPLPILVEAFGHATQRQTLDYLCIQPEEIRKVYENEL